MSPLGAPRLTPQQRSVMNARTDDTDSGVCPPLPLEDSCWGGVTRLGRNRRPKEECQVRLWRSRLNPTAQVSIQHSAFVFCMLSGTARGPNGFQLDRVDNSDSIRIDI